MADIIKDRNESGLTVDEYCKIHNLSRNSYYHYLRELKKEAVQSPEFIELGASGHTCRNVPVIVGQEADNERISSHVTSERLLPGRFSSTQLM